jgi:hypothetical protein
MAASAKEVAQLRAEIQNLKKQLATVAATAQSTASVLHGLIQKLMENKNVANILNTDSPATEGVPVQSAPTGTNENSGG